MVDKVFLINANKINSFITDEYSLKFSSQKINTISEFQKAWDKKLSLATKVEIKYDSIKSIKKEDNDKDILIKYKTWAGIPSDFEFSCVEENDYELFFNFLVKERYFTRTYETLTPFKAIRNYTIGLIIMIAITIFTYYQAVDIENGIVEETSSHNVRSFNYVVGLLGVKGVVAVGAGIMCFIVYKIWIRFSNPPKQTKFIPPNT